ncbi:MAG: hypothetical protein KGI50_06810 [Patescibacteria group bacterium]|nr:hypothetical protein [Patescibacteria group bacterium]MDE2439294.1 hypothetical protein [Patescibacteria group bacterium]
METPKLYEEFAARHDIETDKFGVKAIKEVYCQVILPSPLYREMYEERLKENEGRPNETLVSEIEKLIRSYGWQHFFAALRYLVLCWWHKDLDVRNRNRFQATMDKLDDIPTTVIVRNK